MKTWISIAFLVGLLCALQLACSPLEAEQFALEHPTLAPTTRAVETVQRTIDPITIKAQQGATIIHDAADGAAALGVPGASTVALLAGVIGSLLGVYNERRKGTLPLRSALSQVIQSVEAAFPSKTDLQKVALSSAQDQATRKLVRAIKGS